MHSMFLSIVVVSDIARYSLTKCVTGFMKLETFGKLAAVLITEKKTGPDTNILG